MTMRFVVDAQLPPALARYLVSEGYEATHVGEVGLLLAASDRDIWRYALDHDAVVATKDEDFVLIRSIAETGPAIVWIRIGNTTKDVLLRKFRMVLSSIVAALKHGETVIEVADS